MASEDVVHVLRNVHQALVPRGHVLDIHPVGVDFPVRSGRRGLGFVDARRFASIVDAMNDVVTEAIADGAFDELRSVQRHVTIRVDDAAEALELAEGWNNLRLPAAVRRRLRGVNGAVEFVDTIRYRLLRKRSRPRRR